MIEFWSYVACTLAGIMAGYMIGKRRPLRSRKRHVRMRQGTPLFVRPRSGGNPDPELQRLRKMTGLE